MSNPAQGDGWRSYDSSDQPSPPGDTPPAEAPTTAAPEGEISGVREAPSQGETHDPAETVTPDGGVTQRVEVPNLLRKVRAYDLAAEAARAGTQHGPPGTRPSRPPPRAPSEPPVAALSSAAEGASPPATDPLAPPGPPLDDRNMVTEKEVVPRSESPLAAPTGSTVPAGEPRHEGGNYLPSAAGIPGTPPTTQHRDTLDGVGGAPRPDSARGPSQPPSEATDSTVSADQPHHEGGNQLPSAAGISETPPPPQRHDSLEETGSATRPRSPRRSTRSILALSAVLALIALFIGLAIVGGAVVARELLDRFWYID